MGWKGRYGFEENNEWDRKAFMDLKRLMNRMEMQVNLKRIMSGLERHVCL